MPRTAFLATKKTFDIGMTTNSRPNKNYKPEESTSQLLLNRGEYLLFGSRPKSCR